MNSIARACARLAVIAVASTSVLFAAAPAQAATSCADRVVADWSDNGRIDRVYDLECYEAAIDAIPVDLRDYTNAADVIARALTDASRQGPPSGGAGATAAPVTAPGVDTSSDSSVPLPVIVVVVVSFLVLAAGLVSHLTRRHRTARPPETATD